MEGKNLIFLISQPRAGSTLFQLLLSGHPDIATTSEPWIALHPLYALRESGIDAVYNPAVARNAVLDFLRQSGADEDFYSREVARFLLSLYGRAAEHQGKRLFLDKTPRYYLVIEDLIKLFPGAKFIVLFRNPLAVLNSILRSWIGGDYSSLGEYRGDLMAAPTILTDCVRRHPEQCLKVNYEELTADTKGVLQRVCSFIGISFEEGMLDYTGRVNPDWRFGDNIGIFKSDRPTEGSRETWKKGFVTPQQRLLALSYVRALGPELIKDMGYDYKELESSVEAPKDGEERNLISWATIMSDTAEFSKVREVGRFVGRILSDENVWKENRAGEDSANESAEWRELIKLAASRFRDERFYTLRKEIDTRGAQIAMLRKERDALKAERDNLKAERGTLNVIMDRVKVEKGVIVKGVSWRAAALLRTMRNIFKK